MRGSSDGSRNPVARRTRSRSLASFISRRQIRSFARKSQLLEPSSASSAFDAAETAALASWTERTGNRSASVQFLRNSDDVAGEYEEPLAYIKGFLRP